MASSRSNHGGDPSRPPRSRDPKTSSELKGKKPRSSKPSSRTSSSSHSSASAYLGSSGEIIDHSEASKLPQSTLIQTAVEGVEDMVYRHQLRKARRKTKNSQGSATPLHFSDDEDSNNLQRSDYILVDEDLKALEEAMRLEPKPKEPHSEVGPRQRAVEDLVIQALNKALDGVELINAAMAPAKTSGNQFQPRGKGTFNQWHETVNSWRRAPSDQQCYETVWVYRGGQHAFQCQINILNEKRYKRYLIRKDGKEFIIYQDMKYFPSSEGDSDDSPRKA